MSGIIIHNDGAFNLYSTITDDCIFSQGVDLKELTDYLTKYYGVYSMHNFPARLDRALKSRHSSLMGETTLTELIEHNTAGADGEPLATESFIKRYLTLEAK